METSLLITLSEFEEAKKYWMRKLSGELNEVKLLKDFLGAKQYEEGQYRIVFENYITEKLLLISKKNDLSLYILLLTALKILLYSYLGQGEIIVASPILTPGNWEYNKCVIFRDFIFPGSTFKELLMGVRETVVEGFKNEHYPLENVIENLSKHKKASLGKIFLILENIHNKEFVAAIRGEYKSDISISIERNGEELNGFISYNAELFKKETICKLGHSYIFILNQVVNNTDIKIGDIELITEEDKNQILYEFNNSRMESRINKTIHRLFEEQVEKTPTNIAVSALIDISDVYEELESERINKNLFTKLKKCCFKKVPFIYQSDVDLFDSKDRFVVLKTTFHNTVIVNMNVLRLIDRFNGKRNIYSIFSEIEDLTLLFIICSIEAEDILEVVSKFHKKEEILFKGRFEELMCVVKSIYGSHLIELSGITADEIYLEEISEDFDNSKCGTSLEDEKLWQSFFDKKDELSEAHVLLLGDTPGTPTTGLLYLASYLKRNGIDSYCQFYDSNMQYTALKKNIEELLTTIQPKIVAVSLKWFAYIARVLEICKIVKEFSTARCSFDVKVVVGGNTASYFWKDIISNRHVDYVVRGDGEVPLLKICQEEDYLPNCIYKENGKIIENPISYVQTEHNSSDIYLSHLHEILLSRYSSILGTFFIFTHKGCPMNCFFCGGCRQAQETNFNRVLFNRGVEPVRKDIIEVKKYTSTFMFDFVASNEKVLSYCRKIWEGIDLSSQFCIFVNLIPPSPRLIELANKTFKYVYWDLDIASLSEKHRKKLASLGLVKPQPSDSEILIFFDECEKYKNNEIRINLINGLPYFTIEDIKYSERLFDEIMSKYSCFGNLHWARLHAQPGAPIVENLQKYNMYSLASGFDDFLKISKINFASHSKLDFSNFEYPYIYFNDEKLNSELSKFYQATNLKLERFKKDKGETMMSAEMLSYRELNNRANQLARLLSRKGVQVDEPVGLLLESSLEMAVGILAVLKAGGAYLPLEPSYPVNRKEYILKDCGVKILLTINNLLADNVFHDIPLESLIIIDDETIYRGESANPDINCKSNNLVYIIYTSGTTGSPRGVLVDHKGLVNYTRWRLENYNYMENDVTLQLLSYVFDGFASNFYSGLLSGGRLLLIPDSRHLDFDYIGEIVKYYRVTNISLVPGMYQMMLENTGGKDMNTLRFVVLAGEKSGSSLLKTSREKYPDLLLVNEYGPTETTVTAAVNIGMNENNNDILGKPILNNHVSILNINRKMVPAGVPGELSISGVGVARGYLNNAELTAEKFIPKPVDEGGNYYKTGDMAFWLPDGNIKFLDRMDNQVKIRGMRIEPGEIENQMQKHGEVKESIAVVKAGKNGDKDLYVYFVSDNEIEASELKAFLSENLPAYMLPSYFVQIKSIPLTNNGKIDRKALPDPGLKKEEAYIAPGDEMEERLVEIWSEVLGVKKSLIGKNANFFELGGHSLRATVATAKINRVFNIKLSSVEIFNAVTLGKLAERVKKAKKFKYRPMSAVEKKEIYPLSAAQKRIYVQQQMRLESTSYNVPIVVVVEGNLDIKKLEDTFRKLIKRHESFRTSFEFLQKEPKQKISADVEFEVEYFKAGEEEEHEIIKSFRRPFDLGENPLLRAGLINTGKARYILMIDMHHIISDGISQNIFIKDFISIYKGRELLPLRLQYKDFSEWKNKLFESGEIKEQERYWLSKFKDNLPDFSMPTDYIRPSVRNIDEGGLLYFTIERDFCNKLYDLIKRTETTLFMVLLAVYNILLSKYTQKEDIVVGAVITGRSRVELQGIVGIFLNILAMRNQPGKDDTFKEFLNRVKENTLEAYKNQDYPFDELIVRLGLQGSAGRNPLFDAVINLNNMEIEEMEDIDINVRPYERGGAAFAKFDLYLQATEKDGKIIMLLRYSTELFKISTIEKMKKYFVGILEQVVDDMETKLGDITTSHDFITARSNIHRDAGSDFIL